MPLDQIAISNASKASSERRLVETFQPHDVSTEDVSDEIRVDDARPGADIGEVGHPESVRQVEDFEGVVQLGLGVSNATCYRAFILTSPTRLVIDIQAS